LQKEGHLVSFTVDGIHPHDMASFLAAQGICVRAGTLCASPLFSKLGLSHGAVRASFYGYTTQQDVEALVSVVREAQEYHSRF
jgi:cysteine desulfurase/selenocysteine lyase